MRIENLTPNEWWATAAEDIQIATAVQNAYREGIDEVEADYKKKADAEKRKEREEASRKAAIERYA